MNILDAALEYVDHGFKVFPVSASKIPLTPHGLKDATITQGGCKAFWGSNPNAGIGLVTDGLIVLDFDVKAGGMASKDLIEGKYGILPKTRTHRTGGGGLHYLYKNAVGMNARNATGFAGYSGVDIRANGGYIVAPPSIHATGNRYKVLDNSPIIPAPDWLVELLKQKPIPSISTNTGESLPILPGQRNATLARMAGSMRRQGMIQEAIEAALLTTNKNQCNPALDESEVLTIAKSISRYDPDILDNLTNQTNDVLTDNSDRSEISDQSDSTDQFDTTDRPYQMTRGRVIAKLVDVWLGEHKSEKFDLDTICRHLDIKTRDDRHLVVKKLSYEVDREHIEKSDKLYTSIDRTIKCIDWMSANTDEFIDIRWPFGISDGSRFGFDGHVTVSPGDIIVVAGVSNMGKTTFCQNVLWNNMDTMPCTMMGNELTPIKFKRRVSNMNWANPIGDDGKPKFELIERREDWKYVIRPNNLNIIDWISMDDGFYKIGKIIEGIQSKLVKGCCVIALQKDANKTLAVGGHFSMDLASLYLAIDYNRLTVVKAKEWNGWNPNGKTFSFEIINSGTQFSNIHLKKKCGQCAGTGTYRGAKCGGCEGSGYIDDVLIETKKNQPVIKTEEMPF